MGEAAAAAAKAIARTLYNILVEVKDGEDEMLCFAGLATAFMYVLASRSAVCHDVQRKAVRSWVC